MKQKRRFWKWLGAVLFCAVTVFSFAAVSVQAAPASEVIRVAFYPLDGFFVYDEQGHESGYGVDLLNKVSQYTGIEFEYVAADSWEDTKQMLLDNEADLRMPATKPISPSPTLRYSDTSILDTYSAMMALNTRNDLYYQDYDTIRHITIAVSENFYNVTGVKNYLDSIGVTEEQLIFCDEYNECRKLLEEGKADALVSNIMDLDEGMKMLARFNNTSNYFSMLLDNSMLNTLDEAMAEIKLDEPLFLSDLYARWFPERTVIPLTLEESEYLSSVDYLTFAFQENEGYLSRCEDGTYYGIYTELAKCICEKVGVTYKEVSTEDCQEGKAKADIYAGFFYDRNYAEKFHFSISAPVNDINYYIIQKKERKFNPATCRIAAIKKFRYTSDYLENQYSNAQFIYLDTYKECLEAVEEGRADMTVINNYIAEYYLDTYQFSDLSARLSTEYSHLFCFAAANNNEVLASILTKALSMISDEEMSVLYIRGQEQKPESNYLHAVLYQNPLQFALAIAGIISLVIVVILLLIFAHRSKKQNRKLEQALSEKQRFLARMSHDMRTPMNGILGLSYLMENQEDAEQIKSFIPQLRESGEYLLQLINDVLDVNRIESGGLTLHPRVCDEERIFTSIINMLKPLTDEKQIDFQFVKKNIEWTYMFLDEQRVKQIFVNLLGNAIKFTPIGGKIDFIMELVSQSEELILDKFVIRDTGIGMSREFLNHLFEPFVQEERIDTDCSNGTGLGLTIVKQLVELMNGTISIESEVGVGTEVTVFLQFPLASEPEEKPVQITAQKFDSLAGRRILMCEDHPLNAQIAIKLLEQKKMKVTWAKNGKVGLDAFEQSAVGFYDAVIMDIRMPVMDGITAAKAIRAMDREDAKMIPIIAMTANAYESDIMLMLEAGMNVHLAKPIEPDQLYATLREQISN